MQIYEALKKDHEQAKRLLKQLIDARGKADPASLVEKIRDAVVPHSRAEEAAFYNHLRGHEWAARRVLHSYREHLEAEALLRALQLRVMLGTNWKETARQLQRALESHIKEEEDQIFPLAKKYISDEEATRMERQFRRLKAEAKEASFMKNTFDMVYNMVPKRLSEIMRMGQKMAG